MWCHKAFERTQHKQTIHIGQNPILNSCACVQCAYELIHFNAILSYTDIHVMFPGFRCSLSLQHTLTRPINHRVMFSILKANRNFTKFIAFILSPTNHHSFLIPNLTGEKNHVVWLLLIFVFAATSISTQAK